MTPAERRAALVKKMAEGAYAAWNKAHGDTLIPWVDMVNAEREPWRDEMSAALDIALEQAAQVIEGSLIAWNKGTTVHSVLSEQAANIRALKGQT